MDEYKILADIYDILNPKEEVLLQKPFFEELVQKHSIQSVLDCACGTGLHLRMFSDMGLQCSGSDISPDMLRIAKRNLEGTYISLKERDYRSLGEAWHDPFDMVVCLTTSLPHMLTDEDVNRALSSMYDALRPGGVLVITNGITDALLDAKPKFIPARVNVSDAFYFVCEYVEEKTMTFNILYVKQGEEHLEHVFTSVVYNAMRKSVLSRALSRFSFQSVEFFGEYDFSEYDSQVSSKMIVVAKKSE